MMKKLAVIFKVQGKTVKKQLIEIEDQEYSLAPFPDAPGVEIIISDRAADLAKNDKEKLESFILSYQYHLTIGEIEFLKSLSEKIRS